MNRTTINIMALAVTATIVYGCGTYKKYERPYIPEDTNVVRNGMLHIDNEGNETANHEAFNTTIQADSLPSWRDVFTDPLLQSLIEEGVANNADLAVAHMKVVEATATLATARKALLPSVDLTASGSLSSYDGSKATKEYSIGPEISWEVDIFGKLSNEKRIQAASLEESQAYAQAVQTELVATIACQYYMLMMYDEQIKVTLQTVESWREYIATQKALLQAGQAKRSDVSQAEASRLAAMVTLETLKQQTFELENSLSTLVGRAPGNIERGKLDTQTIPATMTGGISLASLASRPDVREAEAQLKQAFYSVNKAHASFYPSVTLSGSAGWTNSGGSAITNPGAWLLQALGSIVQPLFNQGKLKANLTIAKTQQEEAVIQFRQSLLTAAEEVNNALSNLQSLAVKVALEDIQITSLEQTVTDTETSMKYGEANYLQVVVARQSLLSAQLDRLQNQYSRLESAVTLYKALGGGYR